MLFVVIYVYDVQNCLRHCELVKVTYFLISMEIKPASDFK